MASMCFFVSGPGSMTATSSMPTRYVFVPGPVIGPGFGATMRRTSGDSALRDARRHVGHQATPSKPGSPGSRMRAPPASATTRRLGCADGVEQLAGGLEAPQLLEVAHGREDDLELSAPGGSERVHRSDPHGRHGLAVVVQVRVPLGRGGHEEPACRSGEATRPA